MIKKLFKDNIIKGAVILTIGGFVTKVLGALYRVPLTNMLGTKGIGIYQAAFPLYCVLLTISSTGIPSALAKIIATNGSPKTTLKKSLKVFLPIGATGSILMATLSGVIAKIQGEELVTLSYIAISPSVLLVTVISCFRGYYQGLLNMKPTSFSQVLEQSVKLLLGLLLVSLVKGSAEVKASVAVLAVTISELVTVVYFIIKYKLSNKTLTNESNNVTVINILKITFPITLSTLILPIIRTVDSFLILNILDKYLTNSTELYGIYSGVIESIIGVPVALLYGFATSSVPVISKAFKNNLNYKKSLSKSLIYTFSFSLICASVGYFLSPIIIKILYPKLFGNILTLTVKMLRVACISIVLLPLMQTSTAVLISVNKIYYPCVSSTVGGVIKVISLVIMLNNPKINIFASVLSDIIYYFVACFLNLVYIKIVNKKNNGENKSEQNNGSRSWGKLRRFNA